LAHSRLDALDAPFDLFGAQRLVELDAERRDNLTRAELQR
jgi:hypothetical protein